MIKPGSYEAKNSSMAEYIKVLMWGVGFPFGIIGTLLLIVVIVKL